MIDSSVRPMRLSYLRLGYPGEEGGVQLVSKVQDVLVHEAGRGEAPPLGPPQGVVPQRAPLTEEDTRSHNHSSLTIW